VGRVGGLLSATKLVGSWQQGQLAYLAAFIAVSSPTVRFVIPQQIAFFEAEHHQHFKS